tara:strand:+ start:177 stop:386 length:210 start_codon:yes stop_codon:yes gene_type:complete
LSIQFVDYARNEVISNEEADTLFFSSFIELYGPPPGGPEILEHVLDGKIRWSYLARFASHVSRNTGILL